jgi:hypothetical protein
MENLASNPGKYKISGRNCVAVAVDVLKQAGVDKRGIPDFANTPSAVVLEETLDPSRGLKVVADWFKSAQMPPGVWGVRLR